MSEEAKEIANLIYPEKWVRNTDNPDFKIDNNAGKRAVAEDVAGHFLRVLKDEKTASAVMHAFYRRQHNHEPHKDDVARFSAQMGTALLAYELRLKDHCSQEYK